MTGSPKLQHRPSRTIAASITGLVLLAVGVLSVLVAVLRLSNGYWPAAAQALGDFFTSTTWTSPVWVAICIAVAVLGLVLIVAAVKAGALNAYRLDQTSDSGKTQIELVISRRAVARLAGARADQIDGVDSVSVSASANRVRVAVGTTSTQTAVLEKTVTDAVTQTLTSAGLHEVPRVSTTARTKEI